MQAGPSVVRSAAAAAVLPGPRAAAAHLVGFTPLCFTLTKVKQEIPAPKFGLRLAAAAAAAVSIIAAGTDRHCWWW